LKRSKALEKAVAELLALKKIPFVRFQYYCYKCKTALPSKKGWPDYFCWLLQPDGSYQELAIECKTGKGRLTKEQREVKEYMEKSGVKYIELRDNLDLLLEELG